MKSKSKINNTKSPFFIVMFVILLLYAISIFSMLIWGFYNSFKDSLGFEYADNPIALPSKWHFENILVAFDAMKIEIDFVGGAYATRYAGAIEMYYNSILYAIGGALVVTVTPCFVSYVVCKYGKQFKFLNIYTGIVIVCMSIHLVGSDASALKMSRMLGIYDTIWGLWIMKAYFLGMYYLVFLGAFGSIPDSFMESAKIDGASNFGVMIKIMLPLVKNTFFTIWLLQFIGLWNDYQTPLLYIPNRPTISYGLFKFGNSVNAELATVPMQLMGSMVVFVPVLIIFCFLQKRIMGNISMGGLKE